MSLTRDQFKSQMQFGFYPQIAPAYLSVIALCTNDKTAMDTVLTQYMRCNLQIDAYLAAWDAAPDQTAKDAVVDSVVYTIGTDSVNPDDAVMWPGAGGRFGNVVGPASSTDQSQAVFDGVTGQQIEEQSIPTGLVIFTAPVDGKTVGNTVLGTVATGKTFIPIKVNYALLAVSGLVLVSTISTGSNSPNYNNISGPTLLTGLNALDEILDVSLASTSAIAGGSTINARVSIASTATTYDLQASVIGFYI